MRFTDPECCALLNNTTEVRMEVEEEKQEALAVEKSTTDDNNVKDEEEKAETKVLLDEDAAQQTSEDATKETSENNDLTQHSELDEKSVKDTADGSETKDEEVWKGIELVGLSPKSQKVKEKEGNAIEQVNDSKTENDNVLEEAPETESVKNERVKVKGVDIKDKIVSDVIKDLKTADEAGETTEDGYKSGDERESLSESDREDSDAVEGRLRRQEPKDNAESEGEGGDAPVGAEDNIDRNFSQESGGYSDDEHESGSDIVIESEEDEAEEDKEEAVKSPAFVPRRTGFWDHDDRFADMSVEETREPQGGRKLWDKSEVAKWRNDKYVESEQGPKEEWERVRQGEEREQRRSGDRGRRERNFNDFLQDASRSGNQGRGGRGNRGRGNRGRGDRGRSDRGRRQYQDDRYENKRDASPGEDWESPEKSKARSDSPKRDHSETSMNWQQKQSYRNERREQNRNKQSGKNRYEESYQQGYPYRDNQDRSRIDDRQYREEGRSRTNREVEENRRKGGEEEEEEYDEASRERMLREERRNIRNRDSERRDERQNGRRERDWDENKRSPKEKKQIEDTRNNRIVDRKDREHENVDEGGKRRAGKGRGRGRGRGVIDDKFKDKRSDNVGRDKSNREKRIENLPPRLRDKEREKMEHHEKSKDKHRQDRDDHDKDVYQDAEEPQSPDDGAPRDKPKRYSSQRQKTGASLLDIPGQIPEDEESRTQYYNQLGLIQQTMFNTQQLTALQSQQQGLMSNKNIASLEQQILHLQGQLQQQLNLRSQPQAVPNMMQAHPNIQMQMVQPIVQGVDQQGQVYSGDSMYNNMNQPMMANTSAEGMPMPNPQINPLILNQIMAAAAVQQHPVPGGGLFVAPPQTSHQQQHQQTQINDAEQQQQLRKSRPAAIPIKPPPGL
ncbi:zinc finger CCCH domain-containing protein 13-like isoform X2 [Hydractinia symbiolongicarpus]|uniref:zinc finger CCCH domain-containing protein 13-like isoform X2 n=1 Tax=Hydractinia symbiolongicarpus TaxID=13093 RepID=UPI00254D3BFF|nr:zinc finger CCCH domain-containing protein 13-like isoform X2 [Hydractinia symbiolongicarpus]XP_057303878.1 zinc finger CCCH domain-containing protein 13-like isoform X2 [Hydractinia symbiolongicarpus]